ncbi:Aldehyde dehydrogenase, mitochondrial, putative [Candida maltosa Xu316]|uniref:Aldehyde dehydrogenase, mitochondrial, putative n=1 Tax=Candida maltosa (strain Xu316) TaxID=1245528 RepID=M3JF59_CANMX|nr:Aldehyde dehydrogenase, mitochondrial, putative [Candida maltosa Xu316]
MFKKALPLVTKLTTPKGLTYNQPLGLFINNEYVTPKQNKTFEVISPSSEEKITDVYEALPEDIDTAVEAARAAYDNGWATGPPEERAKVLFKLADLVEENAETLAQIETWDNGKSLQNARGDVALTAAYFRSAGGWADKILGNQINTGSTHFNYTQRVPMVCGQATGCTTVLKPAESTPLSALYLSQLLVEAGMPKGVVNIVSGFGATAGAAIAKHPKIEKVAFTGSTATGKTIMKLAAESNLKKVTLELGGKSPNIVFNDADLDNTIGNLVLSIFYNSGEVCCAGSRLLVQSGVYDEVVARFKDAAENLKVGNPFDEDTFMGSQASEVQLSKILRYIEEGKKEGATVVTGGARPSGKGYFIKPTIFADVNRDMSIVKDEIFGPVVTLIKFDTVEEAIALANDTDYGLAAGIHSTDINKCIEVANRVKAGTVWVNTYNDFNPMVPFGGFSASGIGREMGEEVLHEYTQVRAVRVKLNPPK